MFIWDYTLILRVTNQGIGIASLARLANDLGATNTRSFNYVNHEAQAVDRGGESSSEHSPRQYICSLYSNTLTSFRF